LSGEEQTPMDVGKDTDAKIAQLSGDVQKIRAIVVGEANATGGRLRAVERATAGVKTTIAAAAVLVLIGVVAVALALGQFLTSQIRAAVADAARLHSPVTAPAPPDSAAPAPTGSRTYRPSRTH
jgi:hypothetical protein